MFNEMEMSPDITYVKSDGNWKEQCPPHYEYLEMNNEPSLHTTLYTQMKHFQN